QMLTGKPYDQLAGIIDWGVQTNHYTTWKELRCVLTELGWQTGGLRKAESWGHRVPPDHRRRRCRRNRG
ncbi:hypothetical protein AB9F35_36970, partial [Rhizobium leguminosarum]